MPERSGRRADRGDFMREESRMISNVVDVSACRKIWDSKLRQSELR